MWCNGYRMGDRQLAAFYREQALVLARRAMAATDQTSRSELMEMAATFQRLALREEGLAAGAAANTNTASSGEQTG